MRNRYVLSDKEKIAGAVIFDYCSKLFLIYLNMNAFSKSKVDESKVMCLNCQELLLDNAIYCYNCGQAVKDGRLSLSYLLKNALSSFFNLDNRIFRTFRYLYNPAKLTRAFVQGKRREYTNPAKLFLFSLLAVISLFMFNLDLEDTNVLKKEITKSIHNKTLKDKWDILVPQLVDSIDNRAINPLRDSLFGTEDIDSTYLGDFSKVSFMGFKLSNYKIKTKDAYSLSYEEIFEKYKITKFSHKLFIKQYIKTINNTSGSITNLIKNFSWILLFLLFFMALVMTIFYYRSNYYYVEHLVLLMYMHAFVFISMIMFKLINSVFSLEKVLFIVPLIIILIQYFSIKKYYKQSRSKTILKIVLLNTIYFFSGLIIVVLGAVITFFIF